MENSPGLFARIAIAFVAFFKALFSPPFAAAVRGLSAGGQGAVGGGGVSAPERGAAAPLETNRAALHLLALLQRDGRLVDFLQEEMTPFSDAEIGAAARAVHDGCRRALQSCFTIERVRAEPEGASVTLQPGFDAAAVRLCGNIVGVPPYRGALRHAGWRVVEVRMPTTPPAELAAVIAPAEVELP